MGRHLLPTVYQMPKLGKHHGIQPFFYLGKSECQRRSDGRNDSLFICLFFDLPKVQTKVRALGRMLKNVKHLPMNFRVINYFQNIASKHTDDLQQDSSPSHPIFQSWKQYGFFFCVDMGIASN